MKKTKIIRSKTREIIEKYSDNYIGWYNIDESDFDKLEKELQEYIKDIIKIMAVYGQPTPLERWDDLYRIQRDAYDSGHYDGEHGIPNVYQNNKKIK